MPYNPFVRTSNRDLWMREKNRPVIIPCTITRSDNECLIMSKILSKGKFALSLLFRGTHTLSLSLYHTHTHTHFCKTTGSWQKETVIIQKAVSFSVKRQYWSFNLKFILNYKVLDLKMLIIEWININIFVLVLTKKLM